MGNTLGHPSSIVLTDEILAEIGRIGLLRYPAEACGILLPTPLGRDTRSQVVELPNRSMQVHDSYHMSNSDVSLELRNWADADSHGNEVAVWHTHPQANVGPSRGDLQEKLEGIAYLVVALTDTGPVPAWF